MTFFLVVQVGLKALFKPMLLSNREWQKVVWSLDAETLSRVVDDHDRDSMIYSDGAGATIIEATDDEDRNAILRKCHFCL